MNPSDKRFYILNLLENYEASDAMEERSKKEIVEFVKKHPDCFDNNLKAGHVTASSLVVDKDFESTLLTLHTKLDRWLQFGGHSDNDPNALAVALRETAEESCLESLHFLPRYNGIFDLDVHPIPENSKMPTHNHYDIRILLVANKNEEYTVTHESKNLKWVKLDEVSKYNAQPAFLRLVEKAKKIKRSS